MEAGKNGTARKIDSSISDSGKETKNNKKRSEKNKGNTEVLMLLKESISILNEMAKLFKSSSGAINRRIKDVLQIKEPFFISKSANENFFDLMQNTAKEIRDFILSLQENKDEVKISVSLCFITNAVVNKDTQVQSSGFWTPYVISTNYDLVDRDTRESKQIPERVMYDKDNTLKFVSNSATVKQKQGKGQEPKDISVDRTILPHGGVSFSERFIKKIKVCKNSNDQLAITAISNFDKEIICKDSSEINNYFNDGTNMRDEDGNYDYPAINDMIQKRCQLIVVPIECQANKGQAHLKRIGYLQVTGYIYDDNGQEKRSDFIVDETREKFIISTLKCYAEYIVLANKIEALKHIVPTIEFETKKDLSNPNQYKQQLSIHYGFKNTETEEH